MEKKNNLHPVEAAKEAAEGIKQRKTLETVTIRFAGDSGDGMQLTGSRFTDASAIIGNDISTMPDFPAEIRAPAGTLPGVSGFQISFSSRDIRTPGDAPDVLVAMNPAALKINLPDLVKQGTIIANTDGFTDQNLDKAGYKTNPLEDGSLANYQVIQIPMSRLNREALKDIPQLTQAQSDRCKNFFALGIMFWLYDRPLDMTLAWIKEKFAKVPEIAQANEIALKKGYHFAETTELLPIHYKVPKANLPPGTYREVTGNEATALGLITAAQLTQKTLFYGSYPITPASDILHELSKYKNFGIKTFQAEDEIAAVTAAIGASFAGNLGATGTSGPGLALKTEAINLAVMVELPLLILDIQRGGPSTGLPTKTEQADLLQAFGGRNSESPVAIVAPATPSDCFAMILEAVRLATTYMTPVYFLSDGYLASSSEPWEIPKVGDLPKLAIRHRSDPNGFYPYLRDEKTLARPWVVPGTPGLEHRIGGLEKADTTGNVSYDPENHQKMVTLRAEKIARIANDIPEATVSGDPQGELLIIGWGSTYGAIFSAVEELRVKGRSVSHLHLRYLNPFPKNLGSIFSRFKKILVPEGNMGQLLLLLRGRYLVNAVGFPKVKGRPFQIREIAEKAEEMLKR